MSVPLFLCLSNSQLEYFLYIFYSTIEGTGIISLQSKMWKTFHTVETFRTRWFFIHQTFSAQPTRKKQFQNTFYEIIEDSQNDSTDRDTWEIQNIFLTDIWKNVNFAKLLAVNDIFAATWLTSMLFLFNMLRTSIMDNNIAEKLFINLKNASLNKPKKFFFLVFYKFINFFENIWIFQNFLTYSFWTNPKRGILF